MALLDWLLSKWRPLGSQAASHIGISVSEATISFKYLTYALQKKLQIWIILSDVSQKNKWKGEVANTDLH